MSIQYSNDREVELSH